MADRDCTLTVPSRFESVHQVSKKVLTAVRPVCVNENILFDIRLAVEEAVRNAIVHGNKLREERSVFVRWCIDGEKISISVEDEGAGFDLSRLPDPTREENLTKEGGRGVFLLRNVMDEAVYSPKGNKVIMVKFLPPQKKRGR